MQSFRRVARDRRRVAVARRTHRQGRMLEVISRSGIGFDTVDLDAAAERRIVVCNTPDAPSISTAEHTISLLMAATKFTANNAARLRAGRQDFYAANEGIELSGTTIGVVGHGRIGSRVARMCAAMDMRVIVCDPYVEVTEHEQVDFDTILAESRVITLHTPLTDETGTCSTRRRSPECRTVSSSSMRPAAV